MGCLRLTLRPNRLTQERTRALLDLPDPMALKGQRNRALLALPIHGALRRPEAAGLPIFSSGTAAESFPISRASTGMSRRCACPRG
jgi:hypothetical protein